MITAENQLFYFTIALFAIPLGHFIAILIIELIEWWQFWHLWKLLGEEDDDE